MIDPKELFELLRDRLSVEVSVADDSGDGWQHINVTLNWFDGEQTLTISSDSHSIQTG